MYGMNIFFNCFISTNCKLGEQGEHFQKFSYYLREISIIFHFKSKYKQWHVMSNFHNCSKRLKRFQISEFQLLPCCVFGYIRNAYAFIIFWLRNIFMEIWGRIMCSTLLKKVNSDFFWGGGGSSRCLPAKPAQKVLWFTYDSTLQK